MLALVLVLLSQVTPDSRVSRVERVPGGRMEGGRGGVKGWAFFEAFPVGGAGTTTACSTTPPTGAKGEVLTFSRTGNATCTKTATGGLATTGIANGDLVVMSANQPRVEYDSAGTLGLLVESARTNSALRSQELDNAAWTSFATGVASPTITADNAVAPDGTTTAERFQIPAVTTAQNSIRFQSPVTTSTAVSTCSVYVKGNASSETTDICLQTATGYTCSACAFVSSSWSRCAVTATAGGALQCFVGNAGSLNGTPTARNAVDFFAWGFQAETGAYATSYIPTTSAAVTRNVESDYFTHASTVLGSAAVTWQATPRTTSVVLASGDATNGLYIQLANTTSVISCIYKVGGVAHSLNVTGTINPATSTNRASCSHDGATITACINGTCQTNADVFATPSATTTRLGSYFSATFEDDGPNARACVDSSPTRCP